MSTQFLNVSRTGRPSPLAAIAGALLLAVLLAAPAGAATLRVIGVDNNANPPTETVLPPDSYRWLVEEDLTYHVPFDNQGAPEPDPNTVSVGFHRSYMPVIAQGDGTTFASLGPPLVSNGGFYYVSVLPNSGYSIGGAAFQYAPGGQTNITVYVNKHPIPTAQIVIQVCQDTFPINGVCDPTEQGLGDFEIILEDGGGRYGMSAGIQTTDAFGNPLGTVYQFTDLNTNGVQDPGEPYVADPDGLPIITEVGTGVHSGPDGWAIIKNLAPGKYGIQVVPPAGSGWQQTSTIEGTVINDAWVKANEPRFFAEFGPPGPHVFMAFVRPFSELAGSATISGQVVNLHLSRPPDYAMYAGEAFPHTNCWVGLNEDLGGAPGQGLFAAPCREDGKFEIPGVPNGNYQLVIWDDNLDLIFASKAVTVAGSLDLGKVPAFQWFTRLENWVFNDKNENGQRDCVTEACNNPAVDEVGIPEQNVNLRWRDGTMNQSMPTDLYGFVPFDEVFPFFSWQVAEVDFARFKATGATVYVDDGGPIPFDNPNSWGGNLNPQRQGNPAETDPAITSFGDFRVEEGVVLTEGYQGFIGQTSVIEWGKKAYGPNENGGVSGVVYYSVTRAEDDPRYGAAEPWEPGIPNVPVYLYDRTGTTLLNAVTTDSWDASVPTNCQYGSSEPFWFDADGPNGGIRPVKTDCFDGIRNFNQVRPAVFDGGYAFDAICAGGMTLDPATGLPFTDAAGNAYCDSTMTTMPTGPMPADRYVVRVVPPAPKPGFPSAYKVVRSQDKNVDFGDEFFPSSQLLPPECVGAPYVVPDYLSLNTDAAGLPLPGVVASELVEANLAGQTLNHCDRKLVALFNGSNAAADFFLFTDVPIAAHAYGMILDDTQNEFDPNSPQFGEKYAPPFVPVSIRDWTGREIGRTLSDAYGRYNFLTPSTRSANLPQPSGMSPNMLTSCMNANIRPDGTSDPQHNPQYSQFCYTFQYMPGATVYLDTPVVPVAAFTGADQFPLDCQFGDGTPRIKSVNSSSNPNQGNGPFVQPDGFLYLSAVGPVDVPNPAYAGVGSAEPKTIARDYGFGSQRGTATLTSLTTGLSYNLGVGGQNGGGGSWNTNSINARVPSTTPAGLYELTVTRRNGPSTVNAVTVQVGGAAPAVVVRGPSWDSAEQKGAIQTAIDNAAPGSIISVAPGRYQEMVILYNGITLQGWGEGTEIDAVKRTPEALQAYRDRLQELLGGLAYTLVPGQEAGVAAGVEPVLLWTEEGAGVLVLGKAGSDVFAGARVDGFTISGADTGGGFIANGYANGLSISNNRILNNAGFYGGGIRLGHPELVDVAGTSLYYPDAANHNVKIHHNYVGFNGGQNGAGGGVSLCTGSDNYRLTDNYICGNFNLQQGGGVAHFGLSAPGSEGYCSNRPLVTCTDANVATACGSTPETPATCIHGSLIAGNKILFNQSFFQQLTVSGGGLLVAGQPAFGCPVGTPNCTDPLLRLSPGTGNVTIDANLILGNAAEAGDGGGIRLQQVNGQDAADGSPDYTVTVTNNMINDNIAALAGGGIALVDTLAATISHNTIARNDSTATAGAAFSTGVPDLSLAQPGAGIAARAHSVALADYVASDFSNPTMEGNIVWQNRQFVFAGAGTSADPNQADTFFGLCPTANPDLHANVCSTQAAPFNVLVLADTDWAFSDLGVIGAAGPLSCTNCAITGGTATPAFTAQYFNGNRNPTLDQPEQQTIFTPAAFDEGGNFIRLRFGPLTRWDTATGALLGDYHLTAGLGEPLGATHDGTLALDYDRQARPTATADIGADELTTVAMQGLPGGAESFENDQLSSESIE